MMVVSCQGRFNTLLGCQDWPGSTGTSQLSVKEVLAGHLQMCFLEFPCSPILGGGGAEGDLFTIVAIRVFQEPGHMDQGAGEGSCWR